MQNMKENWQNTMSKKMSGKQFKHGPVTMFKMQKQKEIKELQKHIKELQKHVDRRKKELEKRDAR